MDDRYSIPLVSVFMKDKLVLPKVESNNINELNIINVCDY